MNEAYVSYEVAKLLKEGGFDWAVLTCYQNSEFRYVPLGNWNKFSASTLCSAPTQQMACRWLRKEHKIHITTEPLEMFKQERIVYEPVIYLLNDFDDFLLEYKTIHLKECDTNEDAVEAALEYTLKNLI